MPLTTPDSARCSCGAVVVSLQGAPIGSFTCYCDTCQEGSARIEALPRAPAVRDPYGGTEYVLYRRDRVAYASGRELLEADTLERSPKTQRLVATCCNSPVLMRFDDARHWIAVYRARLGPNAPAVEVRICTSLLPGGVTLPNDVPSYRGYAPAFLMRLLAARLAMLLRR